MAEKPRLKETDEIFSSIGKGASKTPPLPIVSNEPKPAPAPKQAPSDSLIENLLDGSAGQSPRQQSRSSGRRGSRRKDVASDSSSDPKPLDFGKYVLPVKEPEAIPVRGVFPEPEPEPEPAPQPKPAPQPRIRRINPPGGAPDQDAGEQPRHEPRHRLPEIEPPVAPRDLAPPPAERAPEIQSFVFEELGAEPQPPQQQPLPQPQQPPSPPPRKEGPAIIRSARKAPESPPPPPPGEQQPAQSDSAVVPGLPENNKHKEFISQLSNRFDQAFSDAFDGKTEQELPPVNERPRGRARKPYDFEVLQPETPPRSEQEADPDSEREVVSFLRGFEQQVREEEEVRTELFKDTLTEKFERERQRYLKELSIGSPEPPEQPAAHGFKPPSTRKLDVQIDPEMHMDPFTERQPRERTPVPDTPPPPPRRAAGAAPPMTYSRTGAARPLDREPETPPSPPESRPRTRPAGRVAGQKSAEQLLLELGGQSQPGSTRPPPRAMETAASAKADALKFVPPPPPAPEPRKEKKQEKKSNRRIIAVSAIIAAALLFFVAVPFVLNMLPEPAAPGGVSSAPRQSQDTRDLTVYENRNPDTREEYDNIIVKKANISLRNFTVADNLLIADIESPGSVLLEDLVVKGELRVNSGAVDSLVLRNVSAGRLVINNSRALVSVELGGYGVIDTAEIRTSAVLTHTPSQGADGGESISSVILNAAPEVNVLDVTLRGLDFETIHTGPGTVLTLDGDSTVEYLNSEGALSLTGNGRVLKMTAQPADPSERVVLNLGVPVSNLSLKGTSRITLEGQLGTLAISDDATVAGSGEISHLGVDAPISGHRLRLELDGVKVSFLVADAQATVQVNGSGKVMELRANESVYALGNKVNVLYAGAEGVIYENEPDMIVPQTGIRPPGKMSDYPNLDYYSQTNGRTSTAESITDDVSTVCGHTRESGGFFVGNGSVDDPFQVSTPAQLAHVGQHLAFHFIQTADIDISDDTRFISGFTMIGGQGNPFTGSYDGNGFGISNLRISSSSESVGLFAVNSGVLRNIALRSGEVRGSSTSRSFVGGIAGLNNAGGVITASQNGARVLGSATSYVGGITGYNYSARIHDCYNAAKITGTSNVGGLVGVNGSGSTLSGSYNVGTIEGGATDTGAVAGNNTSGGVISNCYFLYETAAVGIGNGPGSALQKDTDEMSSEQMVADLSAGNSESPWVRSHESYTYPLLEIRR